MNIVVLGSRREKGWAECLAKELEGGGHRVACWLKREACGDDAPGRLREALEELRVCDAAVVAPQSGMDTAVMVGAALAQGKPVIEVVEPTTRWGVTAGEVYQVCTMRALRADLKEIACKGGKKEVKKHEG